MAWLSTKLEYEKRRIRVANAGVDYPSLDQPVRTNCWKIRRLAKVRPLLLRLLHPRRGWLRRLVAYRRGFPAHVVTLYKEA
jgi:hypothetical protein